MSKISLFSANFDFGALLSNKGPISTNKGYFRGHPQMMSQFYHDIHLWICHAEVIWKFWSEILQSGFSVKWYSTHSMFICEIHPLRFHNMCRLRHHVVTNHRVFVYNSRSEKDHAIFFIISLYTLRALRSESRHRQNCLVWWNLRNLV